MTDIHSHIIYGIDDGSTSQEESIKLIKKLNEVGFNNIIMTPHYIEGSEYCCYNEEKLEKLEVLRNLVKENNIPINLYLGNEVFINDNIVNDIKENRIYTLNNSKYLLFELPLHNQILNLADIIYEIKIQGYMPILAHPERYSYFQEDYNLVDNLRKEGLLFQANYASILGYYGKSAEKLLKYMLKNEYIDYLGTDIHHVSKTYVTDNFNKIEKLFNKVAGKEYYEKIKNNCDSLVKS